MTSFRTDLALVVALTLVAACTESVGTSVQDSGVSTEDTGSGDAGLTTPDGGATGDAGGAQDAGTSTLTLCGLGSATEANAACAENLDFGSAGVNETRVRLARLSNGLARSVQVQSYGFDAKEAMLSLALVKFVKTGSGFDRIAVTAPFELETGESVWLEATLVAAASAGKLAASAVVVSTLEAAYPSLSVPLLGSVSGCPAGFADCDGNGSCEQDIDNTLAHCGRCGGICALDNAAETCVAGMCTLGTCETGFGNCDGDDTNGCEAQLSSDLPNCGGCGKRCDLDNAAESCVAGKCILGACEANFGNCDGDDTNACEAQLASDLLNCGSCGNSCGLNNTAESCVAGKCIPGACQAPYGDCDNDLSNGCEINLHSTLAHCGLCNTPCAPANANPQCQLGTCSVASCLPNFANCDGQVANGCEADLNSLGHCGGCDQVCEAPHAAESCVAGKCILGACEANFGNCDGDDTNGCELQLSSDLSNCGGCGSICTLDNATESCVGGKCILGACEAGFGNCDGNNSNGCEARLATDLLNCGGCGSICALVNTTETCVAGKCVLSTCEAPYGDCDNNSSNGCETNLQSTIAHCGACTTPCAPANANPQCQLGTCSVASCLPNFANCDGQNSNGCEANLNSLGHCGGCGRVCALPHAAESCLAGSCILGACEAPWRDCDGLSANGCEANLGGDLLNCGACGHRCIDELPHAVASCDGTCHFVRCETNWWNLDNNLSNGCEYSCTQSGLDVPDDSFVDRNCDGIDGNAAAAVFLSPLGSDSYPGTKAQPKLTLQAAINTASSQGKSVFAAGGTYLSNSPIFLANGVSIFGGYHPATWSRSNANIPIFASTQAYAAMANNISSSTTLDRVHFRASAATAAGSSSYGLLAANSSGLILRNSSFEAGATADGSNGTSPIGSAARGEDGLPGMRGCESSDSPVCNKCVSPKGGAGGTNTACAMTNGGLGGKPAREYSTGLPGAGSIGGAAGGAGRPAGQGDTQPGAAYLGAHGANGPAGTDGTAGSGLFGSAGYIANQGGAGRSGGAAIGGGGGGGGGGGDNGCDSYGGGGGGGGAGGCGGLPASGGTSAGGSFALYLYNSSPTITACTLRTGNGGNGGVGGNGQVGGLGGRGGWGGNPAQPNSGNPYGGASSQEDGSNGGRGGNGGNGGRGGHGGGGAGGHSIGILRVSSSNPTITFNTFYLGNRGSGGSSAGNPGPNGTRSETYLVP